MADFRPFYIPSLNEGKTWKVYFHKPKGQKSYVCATEGVSGDGFFTFLLYQDRMEQVFLPGRATMKAVNEAGKELLVQLANSGHIAPDAVDQFTPNFAL